MLAALPSPVCYSRIVAAQSSKRELLKRQRRRLLPNLQVVLSKPFTLANALNFATIRNVFLLSITLSTATMLYAVSEMRGMFADGSNYIVHILASEDFYLLEPARKLVQILQQSLLILGIQFGVTDLPTLARLFTLGALGWPIIVTASCWLVLPRGQKGWIIGPLINLVALCPMTSLAAIGEGMIASCLLWIIFFLVLFRTQSIWGALLAISVTALGAVTHETAAMFFIGLAALAIMRMRDRSRVERLTQFAISAAAIWSACYLISVILHPRDLANRADFLIGILGLAFVELHWSKPHRSRHDGLMRQHFPDHARTKQSQKNPAYSVNFYEFFRPCCCVIAIFTGVDGYSGRSIQWARSARARHNDALVWTVGGLEKRCETGIPAFKACTSGLLWIAAYSECCPNNDDAAVGQYARHGNGDHRATRRESSVADSARNRGPT